MNNDELYEYRIEHEYPTITFTERSIKDHDDIIRQEQQKRIAELESELKSVTYAARLVVNGCRNDYEAVMESVNKLSDLIGG